MKDPKKDINDEPVELLAARVDEIRAINKTVTMIITLLQENLLEDFHDETEDFRRGAIRAYADVVINTSAFADQLDAAIAEKRGALN